jgi:DNA repair exonuclease SbcCD ATPase subunit
MPATQKRKPVRPSIEGANVAVGERTAAKPSKASRASTASASAIQRTARAKELEQLEDARDAALLRLTLIERSLGDERLAHTETTRRLATAIARADMLQADLEQLRADLNGAQPNDANLNDTDRCATCVNCAETIHASAIHVEALPHGDQLVHAICDNCGTGQVVTRRKGGGLWSVVPGCVRTFRDASDLHALRCKITGADPEATASDESDQT